MNLLFEARGTISGVVIGADASDPLVGASVKVSGSSVQTDADGKYKFNLKPGEYAVTASVDNYVQQEQSVTIVSGDTATLDFVLVLEKGTFNATVIDSDTDRPISSAIIEVTADTGISSRTETDVQGKCELSLPPDTYNVIASAKGYLIFGSRVEITFNETAELGLSAIPALEIWPGDTNNDGRISILDILPVGRLWDQEGDERHPQKTGWEMGLTPIKNWNPEEAAFADADGNGVVDEEDVLVIAQNWRKTRPAASEAPKISDSMKYLADRDMLDRYQKMYRELNRLGNSEGAIALREALGKLIVGLKPEKSALLANYPNPFNPDTWIPFVLAEAGEVVIRIYDVNGRIVRELKLGRLEPGYYVPKDRAAYWDGRNESGEQVASDVYFVALKAGEHQQIRRMVLVR